ncbi:MAG: HPF/RaiA family ribosome-associated protein [Pseudomonadota bacterium]
MEIQTNTDHSIEHHELLTAHVEEVVKTALNRFSHQITRVVVHLSEGKQAKNPNGSHRCLMEARIQGHSPVVADDHADSLHQAIHNSSEKLKRGLDSLVGRLHAGAKGGDRIADALIDAPAED